MAVGGHEEPLRVLHVIHGLNTGGAETLVRDYLLLMQGPNIESRAVCFGRLGSPYEGQLDAAGVRVTYLGDADPSWLGKTGPLGSLIRGRRHARGLRGVLDEWKPDVVHTHLPINCLVASALGRHDRVGHGGKRVVLLHTVHSEPKALWFPERARKKLLFDRKRDLHAVRTLVKRHGMRLIALHDGMKRELDELFDVCNTVVVNNGIDFLRFEAARPRAEMRLSLGIPENAFVIGHVGRFSAVKNHRKVVSVFAEVHKRTSDAYLLLVGSGELREEVARDLARRRLAGRSLFLADRLDVPDLMGCMDAFLFPSLFEGLGIALVEAQKAGVRCVASNTVPRHAIISNLVRMRGLDESDSMWAEDVLDPAPTTIEYEGLEDWNMRNVVKRLEALYRGEEVDRGQES